MEMELDVPVMGSWVVDGGGLLLAPFQPWFFELFFLKK